MRKGTLQQVWLRETHYLTQPFWLMRKICERSCHATGRPSLLGRRSGQGSAASWEGGRQKGGREDAEEKERTVITGDGGEGGKIQKKDLEGGKIMSRDEEKKKEEEEKEEEESHLSTI